MMSGHSSSSSNEDSDADMSSSAASSSSSSKILPKVSQESVIDNWSPLVSPPGFKQIRSIIDSGSSAHCILHLECSPFPIVEGKLKMLTMGNGTTMKSKVLGDIYVGAVTSKPLILLTDARTDESLKMNIISSSKLEKDYDVSTTTKRGKMIISYPDGEVMMTATKIDDPTSPFIGMYEVYLMIPKDGWKKVEVSNRRPLGIEATIRTTVIIDDDDEDMDEEDKKIGTKQQGTSSSMLSSSAANSSSSSSRSTIAVVDPAEAERKANISRTNAVYHKDSNSPEFRAMYDGLRLLPPQRCAAMMEKAGIKSQCEVKTNMGAYCVEHTTRELGVLIGI